MYDVAYGQTATSTVNYHCSFTEQLWFLGFISQQIQVVDVIFDKLNASFEQLFIHAIVVGSINTEILKTSKALEASTEVDGMLHKLILIS